MNPFHILYLFSGDRVGPGSFSAYAEAHPGVVVECFDIARDPLRLGYILKFAAFEGDLVCCDYAAHPSVATAYILQYAFGRRINWNHAAKYRDCEVEPRCHFGQLGVSAFWSSFRAIPQRVNPCRLLQYALGLPGCLVPFDTHYMPHTDELNLRSAVPNYELTQESNLVSALPEMDEQ